VCLRLGSWFWGPGIEPRIGLPAQRGVSFSLCPLSLPTGRSFSVKSLKKIVYLFGNNYRFTGSCTIHVCRDVFCRLHPSCGGSILHTILLWHHHEVDVGTVDRAYWDFPSDTCSGCVAPRSFITYTLYFECCGFTICVLHTRKVECGIF